MADQPDVKQETERTADMSPRVRARLVGVLLLTAAFAGALPSVLGLLVFGVNEQRWKEQAGAAAASIWR